MKSFDYSKYAKEYSELGINNTYHVAYRDLPKILKKYSKGILALDYGCGTGRSTQFLKRLGLDVIGVDISKDMIKKAKSIDKKGKYSLIKSGDLSLFDKETFDVILSAFTFDGIFSKKEMIKISKEMERVLKKDGVIINITSSPDLYFHNWASFISNFPENHKAKFGDKVKITVRGTNIVVFDCLFSDKDYREIFKKANLKVLKNYKPLGKKNEEYNWINETMIPPWFIYILKK